MAFDKPTRNRLAAFVATARNLITDEFTQQFQSLYGIAETSLTELAQLSHLDDAGLAVAGLLRERIDYLVKTHQEDKEGLKAAVARLAREQAFTVLNRLAAVRMAEKRGLIAESVGNGYQSKGFKVFEQVARSGLGEIYQRYRRYLFCLFDELAVDLGVLFDRRSPQGLLFPGENTLLALLDLLNGPELEPLWQEDETIGWIYQYYNDPAERKKMREESAAPRNSRELAVRNQFFTPRYVVEFLTDNTLGRIWYEMTKGETQLKERCRYLVRRPTEIFLGPEESAPESPEQEGLSQEELLCQPVYIPHRPLKDPRQLRMLDPACGSMHFGLYAFDLYEVIYEEAWDRGLASLRADFPERDALRREIPGLIIEHNIHGIDIDPRAVQIAGLSLWLRAQRSWQQQRLPARQRPQIRRSNIVCAEPMPGDKAMLREFIASQFGPEEQPAFTFLLERVFDRMTLAGEAGSLLKIEEEISDAVREAKRLWQKGPQYTPGYLFAEALPKKPEQLRLDLSGISDEGFWETAEGRIYVALRTYAEQAESGSYQRRLFAEDAARGFAFIDIYRKRYDAVVMNPPFGVGLKAAEKYLKTEYPGSGNDEVCASFYSRALDILNAGGRIGEISSRTCFFLPTLAEWRINILFESSSLMEFADLGINVLDDAVNETAAYVSEKSLRTLPSVFGMFHRSNDKADSVKGLSKLELKANTFFRNVNDFCALPDRPLCYWVSSLFLRALKLMKPFGSGTASVQMGLAPRDEFRFSRLWWEVDPYNVGDRKQWFAYAKGGELSPYYSDVELLLNGLDDLKEIKAALNRKYPYLKGNLDWVLHPENDYFAPGLTFGQRTSHLRVSVLPSGCYFSVAGKGIFGRQISSSALLQAINTPSAQYLVNLRRESFEMNPQFQEGDVSRMPWPEMGAEMEAKLAQLGLTSARAVRGVASSNEIDHAFILPAIIDHHELKVRSAELMIAENEQKADILIAPLLSLATQDLWFIESEVTPRWNSRSIANWFQPMPSRDGIFYSLGSIFGRWDIRYATGECQLPKLPDPFAPFPVCSPGMLQNMEGLPAKPKEVPADYPLRISWPGILVDDENHPQDIVARLEDALKVIWRERWEAIEQEACELLGVKSLRDYFHKSSGFFADHLKRYTKSRRQAPIYWPLSTTKGSYTLWIYYHRLSDQTLHTALADFVDPKLKDVRAEISLLRASNSNRGRLDELLDLEGELIDFRTEIERIIKLPWQPNLNDGVLITAAPLWRFFRLPKWQRDLKACWDKLEKGEYDWAHLAYSIWPKRVEEVCKKDRSIAIAHGLEHLCQVEPPKPKARRGREKAE